MVHCSEVWGVCSCCYCFKDVHVTLYSHVNSCCSPFYVTVQSVAVQLPVCTWCVQCVAQKSTRRCTHRHCFLINSTLLCTQNDHIFHTGKPHMWVHFTPEQFYIHMYTVHHTAHTMFLERRLLDLEEVGGSAKCVDSH